MIARSEEDEDEAGGEEATDRSRLSPGEHVISRRALSISDEHDGAMRVARTACKGSKGIICERLKETLQCQGKGLGSPAVASSRSAGRTTGPSKHLPGTIHVGWSRFQLLPFVPVESHATAGIGSDRHVNRKDLVRIHAPFRVVMTKLRKIVLDNRFSTSP